MSMYCALQFRNPPAKTRVVSEIPVKEYIFRLDIPVKYIPVHKRLQQRKKIAAEAYCNLCSVTLDMILIERNQEFHNGTIISRLSRHINNKCIQKLHNVRLPVFLKLLQNP